MLTENTRTHEQKNKKNPFLFLDTMQTYQKMFLLNRDMTEFISRKANTETENLKLYKQRPVHR